MKKKLFGSMKITIISTDYRRLLLIAYTAFMTIVILTSSFILITYFNRTMAREVNTYSQRFLSNIRSKSDALLQEKVYGVLYGNFYEGNRDIPIQDFLNTDRGEDAGAIIKIYNSLNRLVTQSTISNLETENKHFLNSVYLYRSADDAMISSREGILYSVRNKKMSLQEINYEPIRQFLKTKNDSMWFSPSEISGYLPVNDPNNNWGPESDRSIITLVKALPFLSMDKMGCVVININETILREILRNHMEADEGDVFVADASGKILSSTNTVWLKTPESAAPYIREIAGDGSGYGTASIGGKTMVVSWVSSTLYDWKYVMVVKYDVLNRSLYIARLSAVLFTLLVIVLASVGLRYISDRIYRPIRLMVKSVSDRLNLKYEKGNEMNYIIGAMTSLSDEVHEMKRILDKNQALIRHKTIYDIITCSNIYSLQVINERLSVVNERLSHPYFAILITEFENKRFLELSPERMEVHTYNAIQLIDGYFRTGCTCISISAKPNIIASLINYDSKDYYSDFPDRLETLMKLLSEFSEIDCNIAISRSTDSITHLSSLYDQACSFLKYSFINNYRNVFTAEDMERLGKSDQTFDMTLLDGIANLMRLGKAEAVKSEIRSVFATLKSEGYTYSYTQNILMNFLGVFCRTMKEQGIAGKSLDRNEILTHFNGITSMDECLEWVLELSDVYFSNLSLRNSCIDRDYISKISAYISDNIDRQISLNSVAKEFHISANYLSKIFKETSGITFSDFIVEKKLQKARELLLSDTGLNITQIAEKLGYLNMPYFISIYKKKYGMTPSQYRKAHSHE